MCRWSGSFLYRKVSVSRSEDWFLTSSFCIFFVNSGKIKMQHMYIKCCILFYIIYIGLCWIYFSEKYEKIIKKFLDRHHPFPVGRYTGIFLLFHKRNGYKCSLKELVEFLSAMQSSQKSSAGSGSLYADSDHILRRLFL